MEHGVGFAWGGDACGADGLKCCHVGLPSSDVS
jgi:hypothetical protein